MGLFLRFFLVLSILVCGMAISDAIADDLRFFGELNYEYLESEAENKMTGEESDSQAQRFDQNYSLGIKKELSSTLRLNGGGNFLLEETKTESDGLESTSESELIRPYIDLLLKSPVVDGGAGYRRTELRESNGQTQTLFVDDFDTFLRWERDDLPELNLRYSWVHRYDDPETFDVVENRYDLNSSYDYKYGDVRYSYLLQDTENRAEEGSESLRQVHDGKVTFARRLLDNRVGMDTSYRINYNKTEREGGGFAFPTLAVAGLFALDATPDEGELNPVGGLNDGSLETPTAIDIGLGGDEISLVNMGLDLGVPTTVNSLSVWVDRRPPSAVIDFYTWEVYVSDDNDPTSEWSLHAVVAPAPFGTFTENRFRISFPSVETRFIKVVTSPLLPTVSGALDAENLFVTELQAFEPLGGDQERESTRHNFELSLTGQISEKTSGNYGLTYFLQESEPEGLEQWLLTNSVGIGHRFNRIFSSAAGVSRTDIANNQNPDQERVAYNFNASLNARYLPTFSQTLSYSGTRDFAPEGESRSDSLMLRNVARLYPGVAVFLDGGYTLSESPVGRKIGSTNVRTGADLRPNPRTTVSVDYSRQWSDVIDEGDVEEETAGGVGTQERINGQVSYTPFRTLSFFTSISIRRAQDEDQEFRTFSVNWSPFPEGTLQFSFPYTETFRSEGDETTRSFNPQVRWEISRHFIMELGYSIFSSDSNTRTSDSNRVQGTFIGTF